ncbi:MAG: P63C domain-containing protein [Henriciella sp.]|nr:P63C domain-containing protein [Henriciella sp.]
MLPKICDVYLKARDANSLHPSQVPMSIQADIIMRGLATVGIVALIDEATGYQKDRANDALAQIMEAFVAKELQAWVKTFPDEYYEELHRLRNLEYPPEKIGKWPQYFGVITNDIVYDRLAPGIKDALKASVPKDVSGRHKTQLHRKLTKELGHPKLKEYMASLITIMKLSSDYDDFKEKLDGIHEKYTEQPKLKLQGGKGRRLKS